MVADNINIGTVKNVFSMIKYLTFLSKILPALNNVYFSNIFKPTINMIFFILNCLLPKLKSGSEYNFQQCKNEIINTFVKLMLDIRIFSQRIWDERNNSQTSPAYGVILLNVSNNYIIFWGNANLVLHKDNSGQKNQYRSSSDKQN